MEKKTIAKKGIRILLLSLILVMTAGMTSMAAEYVTMKKKSGTYISSGSYRGLKTVYNKIVVKKPSLIMVLGNSRYPYSSMQGYLSIKLYNSRLKSLDRTWHYIYTKDKAYRYYGVKPGTYYIKINSVYGFVLGANVTSAADKGGKTKKKAAALAQNKTAKGLLAAGEKTSRTDWYKFHVKRSKRLELTVSADANGYFEFYIYGPSYPKGFRIGSHMNTKGRYSSADAYTKEGMNVKTGTYYIGVKRAGGSSGASGAYSIKWKLN